MSDSVKTHSLEKQLLWSMMNRHGVDRESAQRALLEQICGLSYTTAYRYVKGIRTVSLDELRAIAAHFGENLSDAMLAFERGDPCDGTFVVGSERMACRFWPKVDAALEGHPTFWAKRGADAAWTVHTGEAAPDPHASRVSRVELVPERALHVAVLDSDTAAAADTCGQLQAHGFQCERFAQPEDLDRAMAARPFDAFTLSWRCANELALIIDRIRAIDATCPIGLLMSASDAGAAPEATVAEIVVTRHVMLLEKPLQNASLVGATFKRLAQARSRSGSGRAHHEA